MKTDEIVLSAKQVKFFKYFMERYHEHFWKGEMKEATHCSVAVLLELQNVMFGVDDE